MNQAWVQFMLSLHGLVGVMALGFFLPAYPLVCAIQLIAIGLYSAGWFAEPARRDSIYRWADLAQQVALIGLMASLAMATQSWFAWLFCVGLGYRIYVTCRTMMRPSPLS